MTRRSAILVFAGAAAVARADDPPQTVIDLFRSVVEELASPDADAFFDHFDKSMPGFAQLYDNVVALLTIAPVTATLEFVRDEGTDAKRELQIDWMWRQNGGTLHRKTVQCTIEHQGRNWKITRFAPADFFKPDPLQ